MKTLKEENGLRFPDRVPLLNRQLRWMRFWNWPGWTALLAVLQISLWASLFLWSGPLIRWFDPSAAVLDLGILSVVLLSLLLVNAFVLSAWLLLRLVRGTLGGFNVQDEETGGFTQKLKTCLEAKILTGSFWGLVLLFCLVFWVLL